MTDPLFDEPWAHEAEGVELQWRLREDPERDGGFSSDQWEVWQFKDAVRRRDAARVGQARARARSYAAEHLADDWWHPGSVFFQFVWYALEAGDLGGAAQDLIYWISISSADDVENNNANRTNCREVIDMADRFHATPGGSAHRLAPQIRQGCLKLAEDAYPVLNRDLQNAVTRMARM